MIPFASQRGIGQDLATHLLNAQDNEQIELADVRGAIAQDLHGAFAEWEAQAHALTKCRNYLYSLSINPDPAQGQLTREQYEDYIARVEQQLGLQNQPRAVIFHEKYGREHCHVVWSRIDAENERAVQLAFDKDKLMMVTREFARDHYLQLPDGYHRDKKDRGKSPQLSLYEMHQQRATGLSKEERMEQVTDAWRKSDSAKAFVQALADKGYILASGKRPYVLVDLYGDMNALPKLINNKSVRTKNIREFLEKDFPSESLPPVEQAKKLAAQHRKQIEAHLKNEQGKTAREELKRNQSHRREKLDQQKKQLGQRQHRERAALATKQRRRREELRAAHVARRREIQRQRDQKQPRGLAAFLGRVSGVEALRKQLHRYQDRRRARAYLEQRTALREAQKDLRATLVRRHALEKQELARQEHALAAVEKRESRALEQSLKAESRVAARGAAKEIPAIPLEVSPQKVARSDKDIDHEDRQTLRRELEDDFADATAGRTKFRSIDLEREFNRASKGRDEGGDRDSSEGPRAQERTRRREAHPENKIRRYRRKKDQSKDIDRGR